MVNEFQLVFLDIFIVRSSYEQKTSSIPTYHRCQIECFRSNPTQQISSAKSNHCEGNGPEMSQSHSVFHFWHNCTATRFQLSNGVKGKAHTPFLT